ncbi:DNA-protecting protein DprA [Pyrococcus furiosus DSM 3638]|uniref:DNA processing smf protein homolog n=3 Tax=Pyrococcus furiosus TaxID=2261 RepID=Q8U1A8_PYRFU|nr:MULTISPECIES: DNA-processing protein DprA [Pyrococcus]AAL81437.1 DNA processing smf protein homolog [Pyrococcus furiosus DSM 3638]AFN04096.1 DNA processing SMF protein [Pyrococcus furiosus COM1]MDK2870199.1 hypothetical protein [Pyrococcus sp.]QEK78952.1 DNA-protecting protein DprA [Pyrococcus furiosus DSM 3638]
MTQKKLIEYTNPSTSRRKITRIPIDSPDYPPLLKQIKDPPKIIYAIGNVRLLNKPAVAIVGTRQPSERGEYYAEKVAEFYAKQGFVIVSGLALGIDSIVIKTALKTGAHVIGVLPSPVNDIVPKSNEKLAEKIIRSGGLLISELPEGTKPKKYHFVRRNRIISGISFAVVVIESELKDGTMHTVKFAKQQRRIILVTNLPASGNAKLKNEGFPILDF